MFCVDVGFGCKSACIPVVVAPGGVFGRGVWLDMGTVVRFEKFWEILGNLGFERRNAWGNEWRNFNLIMFFYWMGEHDCDRELA